MAGPVNPAGYPSSGRLSMWPEMAFGGNGRPGKSFLKRAGDPTGGLQEGFSGHLGHRDGVCFGPAYPSGISGVFRRWWG